MLGCGLSWLRQRENRGESDILENEVGTRGTPGPALQAGGTRDQPTLPAQRWPRCNHTLCATGETLPPLGHVVGCGADRAGFGFLLRPWDMLLNLSEPQFPLLQNGRSSHLTLGLLWVLVRGVDRDMQWKSALSRASATEKVFRGSALPPSM